VRPITDINRNLGQGLVHGDRGKPVPPDSFLCGQTFFQRLAQNDSDIFDRVMEIHIQITLGFKGKIKKTMFCGKFQHVVEKGNPGFNVGLSFAVKIDPQIDLRFRGVAG
jgi:hypothetical protein